MVRRFSLSECFHSYPGTLIVIERPDGCGKDTQIRMLVRALKKQYPGRRVITTHEPWDVPESPDGMRIRRILQHEETEIDPGDGKIEPAKFQKLYVGDRYTHWVCLLLGELKKGTIIVCSRERMSTYAYGHAFDVDINEIRFWHGLIPLPDIFIFLDTPAEICAIRVVKRAMNEGVKMEYFEKAEFIERIVTAYRHIRDLGVLPVVSVDGNAYPRLVHERVLPEAIRAIERR